MAIDTQQALCPVCGERGRAVSALTVESLLTEDAISRLRFPGGFSFCRTENCDVSYFGAETLRTADVRVPIFQKSTDRVRPVCYCFNHSVESIEKEVEQTGTSTVPASIREKCKKGLDECEKNNPQGSCCLGNVARVVKSAQAEKMPEDSACDEHSCCAVDAKNEVKTP